MITFRSASFALFRSFPNSLLNVWGVSTAHDVTSPHEFQTFFTSPQADMMNEKRMARVIITSLAFLVVIVVSFIDIYRMASSDVLGVSMLVDAIRL